jgi:hypothetical protein
MELNVSKHPFEDGVEFLDFVAERMRDVDFPGGGATAAADQEMVATCG